MNRLLLICFLTIVLGASTTYAQEFTVRVVGISDGDTFTAINRDNLQLKIRIYGIDAPEKGQDFGNKAKEILSDYVYGKNIVIDVQSRDSWGRYVSYVFTPDGKDVSLLMLKAGMAWHFKKYDSTEEYAKAEEQARKAKTGLWSMADPVAPWDYRSKK
jgi:endonuclease YncB( thermonuclease family)